MAQDLHMSVLTLKSASQFKTHKENEMAVHETIKFIILVVSLSDWVEVVW